MPSKSGRKTGKKRGSGASKTSSRSRGSSRSKSAPNRSRSASASSRTRRSAASVSSKRKRTSASRSTRPAARTTSSTNRYLTDRDEIQQWAEERDASPACVRGTGDSQDVGMIRLDFPGYSGEQSLEPIEWDEWFQKFDESGLALLVQDETARGERSNFNKLVSRDTAKAGSSSRKKGSGRSSSSRRSAA